MEKHALISQCSTQNTDNTCETEMTFLYSTRRLFLILVISVTFMTLYLLLYTAFIHTKSQPRHAGDAVIDKIAHRLDKSLEYLAKNAHTVTWKSLAYLTLAQAIIGDISAGLNYIDSVDKIKIKTAEIIAKVAFRMENSSEWYLAQHLMVPEFWRSDNRSRHHRLFQEASGPILKSNNNETVDESVTKSVLDYCVASVFNNTVIFASGDNKFCFVHEQCSEFLENVSENDSGYVLVHKLLLLYVFRGNRCFEEAGFSSAMIQKICFKIYQESAVTNFDLFLQQSVLCGYGGYVDLLRIKFLSRVFDAQHGSGCFTGQENLCADDSTSLGAVVLGLYLNYLINVQLV